MYMDTYIDREREKENLFLRAELVTLDPQPQTLQGYLAKCTH